MTTPRISQGYTAGAEHRDAGLAGVGRILDNRPDGTELRHGYTFEDLGGLARWAVFEARWRFLGFQEPYEIAWSAIAEELYASEEAPEPRDLIRAGAKAISRHVMGLGHNRGVHIAGTHRLPPGSGMAHFEKFWRSHAAPTPSPEDRIVDTIAFQQIWPCLSEGQRLALMALAAHGDYEQAAAALNMSYHAFASQIHKARKRFLRLWHEGEKPSGVWGHDQRKRRNPHNSYQRTVTATMRRRQANRSAKNRRTGNAMSSTSRSTSNSARPPWTRYAPAWSS